MTPFDLESLQREPFLRRVEYLDETPSTNSVALALAHRDAIAMPLLVLARRQTAGRGRGANHWWSSEGALTFSLLLDGAGLPPQRRSLVSLAAGLAVCETLAELAPRLNVGVKWPNDVYLDGKKICGVLAESARNGQRLVAGIGVNVNNTLAEAPQEVADRAVALRDAVGRMFSLTETLSLIVRRFSDEWSSLQTDAGPLVERLRQRCLLTGRLVTIDLAGDRLTGLCRGIGADAPLLLEAETGLRRCYAGVVTAID